MLLNKTYTGKGQGGLGALKLDPEALPCNPQVDKLLNRYLHALGGYFNDREARRRVPGAAVMVRLNDEIVHLNCYGFANLETGQRVTPTTLFDLGSLSKQFTAIGALNLVINEKINPDSELSAFRCFKYFPRYADRITVTELIHHTSALPDYLRIYAASREVSESWYQDAMFKSDDWYPNMAKRSEPEITNRDVVQWIGSQKLLALEPNSEFEYSNSGYVVLAALIEEIAEEPLASYLNEQIFDPIGMQSTYVFDETRSFAANAPEIVNHAICYNRTSEAFIPVGYTPLNFIYGDGNVHSNILDLAKWDQHLHGLDQTALFSKNPCQEHAAEQIRALLWEPVRTRGRRRVDYGAGWNLFRSKYEKKVQLNGRTVTAKYESAGEFHRGEWLGWRSFIARGARWMAPENGGEIDPKHLESLGIVILTNNGRFNVDKIAYEISQMFWGTFKKDNIMKRFYEE
jgi:CubicO group peptidase (beta-lactamase class C family)